MKMAGTLPCEVNKFLGHTKRLRNILDETRLCFKEINSKGKFDGVQLMSAEMLQEEESEIMSAIEKPPCIIVFGQSLYAKTTVVNLIFGKRIIPVVSLEDGTNCSFRMVRFKHGHNPSVSLSLPDAYDYDLLDTLEAYNGPWQSIPRGDMELKPHERSDPANSSAVLEVRLNHPLLRNGCQVVMSPTNHMGDAQAVVNICVADVSPIVVYAFFTDELNKVDTDELAILRRILSPKPVMFVRVSANDNDICENPHHYAGNRKHKQKNRLKHDLRSMPRTNSFDHQQKVILRNPRTSSLGVFQQLCNLGYLSILPGENSILNHLSRDYYTVESDFCENLEQFPSAILLFIRHVVQSYLINASAVLNNAHNRCLQMFILTAYDMQREMQITPKKIEFARAKELALYRSLLEVALSKHNEIKRIITDSIDGMKDILLAKADHHKFKGVIVPADGDVQSAQDLKTCTRQIQELVVTSLNDAIAGKLVSSINILRETYTGTLTRCLESLEKSEGDSSDSSISSNNSSNSATDALKQILNTAYQVQISTHSGSSLIHSLIEKMKQLIHAMPWNTPPKLDREWKRKVASEMLDSLKASKLAKSLSSQIKDRLNKSHDAFGSALKQLEFRHHGRLDKLEDERMRVRKVYAPKVAKLALESMSLRDLILNGMPQMGREIGRGQYGVVYSCDSWAGHSPCAIKSVVPPDDKHWNDLALEFYYTKHVPPHDRVVSLHGSVIDYMYGGGTSPAVLLIMDRFPRDLYGAIKQGIEWLARLQVAIDVVEGIRFLHSQGLVHRDIKLKNVMLDSNNRGKLTDLGFCKPEAMMSGSVVGTPIHMAPELFTGKYDCSVDVYAFGILFWYVCAGHVKLPSSFEQCANKDQLWQNVKRGLRPERLPQFDEECWLLMSACWGCDMYQRPLLGDVEMVLQSISERFGRTLNVLPITTAADRQNSSSSIRISRSKRPLMESI